MMTKFRREDIEEEYNHAALAPEEFQKVKWGSTKKMLGRFELVAKEIDFMSIEKWLDVGSGTGAFQAMVKTINPSIEVTGIDISKKLLSFAESRKDLKKFDNVRFLYKDFLEFEEKGFDLLTCIGVLQKTNLTLISFFEHAFQCVKKEGILFVDTKNANWSKFEEPDFFPENSHDWFHEEELREAAEEVGFKEIIINGFIPGENKIVESNHSHTIYLMAKK